MTEQTPSTPSSFPERLWDSIFTPGTTPTLLIATNASFAALQVLFAAMLIATRSLHFVALSCICGGLWWSINWFAAELKAAQGVEEEAKRLRRDGKDGNDGNDGNDREGGGDNGETDAREEEGKAEGQVREKKEKRVRMESQSTVFVDRPAESASSSLAPAEEVRKRRVGGMGESTGDLSTDSEWEKLSEEEGERSDM